MVQTTASEIIEKGWQLSCSLWLKDKNILLSTGPIDFERHKYQIEVLEDDFPNQVFKKAAQMGMTTILFLKVLHHLRFKRFKQGVLILFPSDRDMEDISKSRLSPIITANPEEIGSHMKNTDSVFVKDVDGAMLYLRGAKLTGKIQGVKKSSSRLKSISADLIVYDERDEMADAAIDLSEFRSAHSENQQTIELSTPTVPGYGVDVSYSNSDQNVWMIRCHACGHDTCLELEFPKCMEVHPKSGRVYRACMHCRREIFPHHGHWEALFPERSQTLVGRWISQLNSYYVDPGKILKYYNNPPHDNYAEVYNSMLGMAYIAATDELTEDDIYRICGRDAWPYEFAGPSCMGVDVGTKLNTVIAYRPAEIGLKCIHIGQYTDFNDLHDVAKRFGVTSAVIDREPEVHKAREFAVEEPYEIFLCDYRESQRGSAAFDSEKKLVNINRTEMCDQTHALIVTPGRFQLPRKNDEVKIYAKQMSSAFKVLQEDETTGSRQYVYLKKGDDHYFHATNYMLLAAMRIGVFNPESLKHKDRKKDPWDADFEDQGGDEKRSWMAG